MRSHADQRLRIVVLLALFIAAPSVASGESQEQALPNQRPGQAEISRALEKVKADPNLATERTIKMLRWKDSTAPPSRMPGWLTWILGFFRWLEQSARLLLWGAGVVLAALLVVFIARLINKYESAEREDEFVVPTHIRDLDIRPETLPLDIGSAARALWDRGERRASLALMYRGMLSRFAHVHQIPIRDSSTEGDCLALAASHLTGSQGEYASRLVRVWQRFVYGREDVQPAIVYVLCDDFASALDSRSPLNTQVSGGAA